MIRVVCVGDLASYRRCTVDLECHEREVLILRGMDGLRRIVGHRPEDVVWVDMAATEEEVAFMRSRRHRAVTIDEAKKIIIINREEKRK